jgi:O-methyltransferase
MPLIRAFQKFRGRKERRATKHRKVIAADGLRTNNKNLEALFEPRFVTAWEKAKAANIKGWPDGVPDIRWRTHVAVWAAQHALHLEGDFVECGVHTGILSLAICHYLDFNERDKKFYLYDTFEGIPVDGLKGAELILANSHNKEIYFDCYDITKENFSEFANVQLVKGMIPESLRSVNIDKVSYLSIDMNNSIAEVNALEYFWPKLSPSAIVVLDDYAWQRHETQKHAIDQFASSVNVAVASLPTGQGIIIKP